MSRELTFFETLFRCLRSKCPVCGKGRLFSTLLGIQKLQDILLPVENCDTCGFHFAREPGYYYGATTPLLQILALGTGALFAGVAYFLFHADLNTVLIFLGVGVGFGLVFLFRTAVALFIAIDHSIHPFTEVPPSEKGRNNRVHRQ